MPAVNMTKADFRLGAWRVRPGLGSIENDSGVVHITPRSMAVLVHLAEARGEVVSRNQILDAVWPGMSVTPDALSQCVVELRKAFRDDPRNPSIIQTIPKRGLKLIAPVGQVADPGVVEAVALPAEASSSEKSPRVAASRIILAGLLAIAAALAVFWWLRTAEEQWRDPLVGAEFTRLTDFVGSEEHAAISKDGHFIAFVSDRDGPWDVFVEQTGTGNFRNLTRGRIADLRNPAVRMLDFSPDGSAVMIWTRGISASARTSDNSWNIPVLGGDPRPGPAGIAEVAWSPDGKRVVYHPAAPGDPMFVASNDGGFAGRRIYSAPPGIHCHFPVWSSDGGTIYFVRGFVPDEMDVWSISAAGGEPRRLTRHESRVSFPALIDSRTLLYLATAADGSGPWIHALDLEDLTSHRVRSASNAYTSLATTADGRRLVVTEAHPIATLWRVQLDGEVAGPEALAPISIHTQRGVAPRLRPGSLVYRAPKAGTDAIWKHEGSADARELWSGQHGRVIDGPVPSSDGRRIAFTARSQGRTDLYVMNSDGAGAVKLAPQLDVRGAPAWSPDGKWIAIAALQAGGPHLFKLPASGGAAVELTHDFALDPVWSPTGSFILYTTADVGTVFEVRAINAQGAVHPIAKLALNRGSRRLAFLGADENSLVILKGEQSHKEFSVVDLRTGVERTLTNLGSGDVIGDFDVAADGRSIVFDRSREGSDIALIETPRLD